MQPGNILLSQQEWLLRRRWTLRCRPTNALPLSGDVVRLVHQRAVEVHSASCANWRQALPERNTRKTGIATVVMLLVAAFSVEGALIDVYDRPLLWSRPNAKMYDLLPLLWFRRAPMLRCTVSCRCFGLDVAP